MTTTTAPTTTLNSNGSNSSTNITRAPVVHWAQRADTVLLTIDMEDCQEPQIDLEKGKLYFKGKSNSIQSDADHSVHEVTIEFYSPIKVDESKHAVKGRGVEFVIVKEDAKWWPRLTKDSAKKHWLKVDFLKWKDEDDTDDELGGLGGMGGMGGMGMGGMGGMGGGMGQPDFGELMQQFKGIGGDAGALGDEGDEDFESDEDDETQQPPPDLE